MLKFLDETFVYGAIRIPKHGNYQSNDIPIGIDVEVKYWLVEFRQVIPAGFPKVIPT